MLFLSTASPYCVRLSKHFELGSLRIYAAIRKLAMDSGLTEELLKVFSEEEAYLMLDLSMFMLSAKSAVFQEYPHWGRSHAIFSESVRSDSYISRFQKGSI